MAWRARSRRVRRTGPMHTRCPWEPGRPVRLHRQFRLGNRNINSPMPTTARRRSLGANHRRRGGIAKRRQRSAAKGTDGGRSALYYRGGRGTIPRDPAEGRGCRVMRPLEGNMAGASKPVDVSTKRQRIAQLARQSPEMGFTSLAYLIDLDWLTEAFDRTRKDGAVGVDGQDGEAYAADLMGNLQSLRDRAKSGTYQAPPVRRVHIPKAGSATETRPLGIPTLEDKLLQRAVVMLLEPIYEQDFDVGSYGFRPQRSAHDALADLWKRTMDSSGGWVLEVDIRKFFDTLDHAHLRQ